MTSLAAPDLAREALAQPSLHRALSAMVRRRVPADAVEDLAQTVLCDALAAEGIPDDPEGLRRFVAGIARHKVADFHRCSRRAERAFPAAAPDGSDAYEPASPPFAFEARAVLARIVATLSGSRREQETLEWLVREHAGEQLQSIAADVGLPAPAVRKRVSRLRSALRAQWGSALLVLLALGASGALIGHSRSEGAAIVADPSGDRIASTVHIAYGRWRIERSEPAQASGRAVSGDPVLAMVEARIVDIQVRGRRIELAVPGRSVTRTIRAASADADGTLHLELEGDASGAQHVTAKVSGDRMRVTVDDGPLRGVAELVRRSR